MGRHEMLQKLDEFLAPATANSKRIQFVTELMELKHPEQTNASSSNNPLFDDLDEAAVDRRRKRREERIRKMMQEEEVETQLQQDMEEKRGLQMTFRRGSLLHHGKVSPPKRSVPPSTEPVPLGQQKFRQNHQLQQPHQNPQPPPTSQFGLASSKRKFAYRSRQTGTKTGDEYAFLPIAPWSQVRNTLANEINTKTVGNGALPMSADSYNELDNLNPTTPMGQTSSPDNSSTSPSTAMTATYRESIALTIPYGFQLQRQIQHPRSNLRAVLYVPATTSSELFMTLDTQNVHVWRGSSRIKHISTKGLPIHHVEKMKRRSAQNRQQQQQQQQQRQKQLQSVAGKLVPGKNGNGSHGIATRDSSNVGGNNDQGVSAEQDHHADYKEGEEGPSLSISTLPDASNPHESFRGVDRWIFIEKYRLYVVYSKQLKLKVFVSPEYVIYCLYLLCIDA
jgi:hypothetical protein